MSHCKQEGKDRIIFMTKEDHNEPIQTRSVQELEKEDEEEGEGLILPNGEINWSCPCLGGMASGPCGVEFREAFSCFHYSEADPKGSDCIDNFRTMQECMVQYPDLYPVGEEQEKALVEETDEAGQGAPTEEVHHLSESKETTRENVLSSSEISTVGTDVVAVENGTENSKDSVGKETSEAPSGDDKLAEDESAVSDSQGESKS